MRAENRFDNKIKKLFSMDGDVQASALNCEKHRVDDERPQKFLRKIECEIFEKVKFETSVNDRRIMTVIMFCVILCTLHTFVPHIQPNWPLAGTET